MVAGDEGATDPRTPRYPTMPDAARHALLVDARGAAGRAATLAEMREIGCDDRDMARAWRDVRTAALSVGQAANALSALTLPVERPRRPRWGWGWLYRLITR